MDSERNTSCTVTSDSTAMTPAASAVKDSSNSAKSAAGRLHLETHAPLTQQSQSGMTMLSKHFPLRKVSSHTTRPGTLVHSRLGFFEPLWADTRPKKKKWELVCAC